MLGDIVKFLRIKNRLTQQELALKTGLTRSHISAMENNRIPNPGAAAITRLAKAFGVSEAALAVENVQTIEQITGEGRVPDAKNNKLDLDTICDPQLRDLLKPGILNSLSHETTRAIIAIIREGSSRHYRKLNLEEISKTEQVEIIDKPSEAPTRSTQPNNFNSGYISLGRFALAI